MLSILPISHGVVFDERKNMYPSMLWGHLEGQTTLPDPSAHNFGFVVKGEVRVSRPEARGSFSLAEGMYFSCPGPLDISGTAQLAVFQRIGYRGLAQWGGPVEDNGRLCYIDQCRCTLLVSPPRVGDPCFNLLTFPPHTKQTKHIHPSLRLGVVYRGRGKCILKDGSEKPLSPGSVFSLSEAAPHCFHSGDEPLAVIAYHPDTDVGPTDASHPMLSRTYTKI